MSDLEFAAGFIAGEGYFGVSRNYQWKPYIQPIFTLQLHERDEEILKELNRVFNNCGKITHRNNREHVTWKVVSKEGVKEIRGKLEKVNLDLWKKSDKYKNFTVWSKIVDIHCGEETTTTDERINMAQLAKNLNKDAGHNNVDWDEFITRLNEYEKQK